MLKRLWNQTRPIEQVIEEAQQRLAANHRHVERLNEIVDKWLNAPVEHEWFNAEYRSWLLLFEGIDGEIWQADAPDARRLLREHDEAMRRALTVRHAIVALRQAGHRHAAPSAEKLAQFKRSSLTSLGGDSPNHLDWEGPS